MAKLLLNRDFLRFLEEDNFPHRVEVHFGDKKLVCSGMVLAQQSAAIEKLIRDDCGILMFEKMENIGTIDQKVDCIKYMYGANLELDLKNIDTTIKFASFYEVVDLFNKSLKWVEKNLSTRNIFMFFDIASSLVGQHFTRFQAALDRFISKNVDAAGQELAERMLHGDPIDASLFMSILKHSPSNGSTLLQEWAEKSPDNKALILSSSQDLDFISLFPTQEAFTGFISCLSIGSDSVETMQQVLALQQNYFKMWAERTSEQATSSQKAVEADEEVDEEVDEEDEEDEDETGSTTSGSRGGRKNRGRGRARGPSGQSTNRKANDKKGQWVSGNPGNAKKTIPVNNQKNKLFIGNVPPAATVNDIRKPLIFAGPILKIDILGGKNVAFVEYKTVHSAKLILDKVATGFKFKVLDQFVYINECKPRNNPSTTV